MLYYKSKVLLLPSAKVLCKRNSQDTSKLKAHSPNCSFSAGVEGTIPGLSQAVTQLQLLPAPYAHMAANFFTNQRHYRTLRNCSIGTLRNCLGSEHSSLSSSGKAPERLGMRVVRASAHDFCFRHCAPLILLRRFFSILQRVRMCVAL